MVTGTELKRLRVAANLKAVQVAERAGLQPADLSRIEKETLDCSPQRLAAILTAIDELQHETTGNYQDALVELGLNPGRRSEYVKAMAECEEATA